MVELMPVDSDSMTGRPGSRMDRWTQLEVSLMPRYSRAIEGSESTFRVLEVSIRRFLRFLTPLRYLLLLLTFQLHGQRRDARSEQATLTEW